MKKIALATVVAFTMAVSAPAAFAGNYTGWQQEDCKKLKDSKEWAECFTQSIVDSAGSED